ncbi:MAG TPA: hypothetical protein VF883_24800 [Thermoanaerobaculia bacterium]|jgi:predicted transcriptional regulator
MNIDDETMLDDVAYEVYVRQAIESGLADSDAGDVMSVDEVRAEFGLGPEPGDGNA